MVSVHGYALTDDIALVSSFETREKTICKAYFYYKDFPILYDYIDISKVKDLNSSINNSIINLENKLKKEINFIIIGLDTRSRLCSWIKDTLTEEVDKELYKKFKYKKFRKEKKNETNNV